MALQRPEDLHPAFMAAYNAGNADALAALYEPNPTIMPAAGGQAVSGPDALRAALGGLLALKGTLTLETRAVLPAGDLVLLHGQWTLRGAAPDGSPQQLAGHGAEVMRRQPDGTWLRVVDNPFADA
jgi:ketosteroid isomerase-like protein